MKNIVNIRYNEGGFMFTLLWLIGFGITLEHNEEKSITFTFKLWKLYIIQSFAIM